MAENLIADERGDIQGIDKAAPKHFGGFSLCTGAPSEL
jgi:hypothetical protein